MIKDELFDKIVRAGCWLELSDKSEVSYRTIQEWIYNNRNPTLDNAEKVANALGYELKLEKKNEIDGKELL